MKYTEFRSRLVLANGAFPRAARAPRDVEKKMTILLKAIKRPSGNQILFISLFQTFQNPSSSLDAAQRLHPFVDLWSADQI